MFVDGGIFAECLEKNKYDSLLTNMMGTDEYSLKDRQDIIKYLKRIQVFDRIDPVVQGKFLCSIGDKKVIEDFVKQDFCNFSASCKDEIIKIFFICYDYKQMIDLVPDEIYDYYSFMIKVADVFGEAPDYFRKFILNKINLSAMMSGDQSVQILHLLLSRRYILQLLGPIFESAKKNPTVHYWFKNVLLDKIGKHTNYNDSELLWLSQFYKLTDIFEKSVLKHYFDCVYRFRASKEGKYAFVKYMLDNGFRGITSLFTEAVKRNDLTMVELLLPYKPRLEKALAFSNTSNEIKLLLLAAKQERAKGKVQNDVDQD